MAPLLKHLADADRSEPIRALIAHAEEYQQNPDVVAALTVIDPLLSRPERGAAFVIAANNIDSLTGTRTVVILAAGLHEPLRQQVFEGLLSTMVTGADDDKFAASVLAVVAPHLPGPSVAPAIRAARKLRARSASALALRSLAPRLSGSERDRMLREALTAALS